MRTPLRSGILIVLIALAAARCGADVQVVHGIDHRLAEAERALAEERRRGAAREDEATRLRQAQAALAARVAALAAELDQVRRRLAAREPPPPPPERVTVARATPPTRAEVRILETRVWRRTGLPAGMTAALAARLAAVRECVRTQVLAANATAAGAVWVLYGQTAATAVAARIVGEAPGHPGLQDCVLRVLGAGPSRVAHLGMPFHPFDGERIAQLLGYGPTPAAVAAVRRPRFAWPWPDRRPPPGGKGAVCAFGSRQAGGPDTLYPHLASPCAAGLRCCYPCGIAGCSSVCLAQCPVGLP